MASPPRRPASLRLRLAAYSLATVVVSLGLVGLALDAANRRGSEADLRQRMETWVYLALAAIEVDDAGALTVAEELGDPLLNQPASGVYLHMHGARDHWNSPSALGQALPELATVGPGASQFQPPGQTGAFYTFQYGVAWELNDGSVLPFTLSVLVDPGLMEPRLRSFRAGLWRSLGAAGAILALAQGLFGLLWLRPLRRVADDVARIERGREERLVGPYPRELEPLTRNLDRLLQVEKANQARYRHALDSLAHSLKTPLAVIRAGLDGEDARHRPELAGAVEDMRHLIASRLERAAAGTRRALAAPVPVAPVAERLATTLRRVHSQDLKTLDVIIAPELRFYGEERDLLEILGNLLENACKYGAGRVRLSAGSVGPDRDRPGLWLTVENDGAEVSPERLRQLCQRGLRGDERVEGHGLGLTIVSEIVAAYGGDIDFGTGTLGGVSAKVTLPAL